MIPALTFSSHTDRWPLLMGLLFIAVVYAGPRGLIGFLADECCADAVCGTAAEVAA